MRMVFEKTSDIFHSWRKNTLRLKVWHIALSHSETKRGDYIRTTHSKLESSSPVCIQIGLFTLVDLDYLVTKTASLGVSQKFWHRWELREWWVGMKILGIMVMQLDCRALLIAANEPTKTVAGVQRGTPEFQIWKVSRKR
jgi:hypothetical protein